MQQLPDRSWAANGPATKCNSDKKIITIYLAPYAKRHITPIWTARAVISFKDHLKHFVRLSGRQSETGRQQELMAPQVKFPASSGVVKKDYARAVRHSRWVWMLKLVFPIAAIIAIAAFIGTTVISRALPEGAAIGDTVISDGKLIMNNPVMTGPVGETDSYSVTAARAIQDLSVPSVIRLEDIVADFPISGADTALLDAMSGIYNRDNDFLLLDQPFTVTTESGMTARLMDASIDIDEGSLKTENPVNIETAQGTIVAESLVMIDNGAEIIFERDVYMTLNPGVIKQAPDDAAGDE